MAQADDGETHAFLGRERFGGGAVPLLGFGMKRQLERIGLFLRACGGGQERGGDEPPAGAGEERASGNGGRFEGRIFIGHGEKDVLP